MADFCSVLGQHSRTGRLEVLRLIWSMKNGFGPINRIPPDVLALIPNSWGKLDKGLFFWRRPLPPRNRARRRAIGLRWLKWAIGIADTSKELNHPRDSSRLPLLIDHLLIPVGAALERRVGSPRPRIEDHLPRSLDNIGNLSNFTRRSIHWAEWESPPGFL